MKCVFLYNPYSGKEKVRGKADYIRAQLLKKYDVVDVYASTHPGEMTEKAEEFSRVYDVIVFAGGDGTFNEIVQGVSRGRSVPLGYIPCGTVNDIARTLGIPRNIKGAVKNVLEGECRELDVMKVNDRYAMYSVSAGAFTSSSYLTPHEAKKKIGKIAYATNIIKKNLKLDYFTVTVRKDGQIITADAAFVLFMNSKSVAGFRVNKTAELDDNKVEAVIVMPDPSPRLSGKIRTFFTVLKVFFRGYESLVKVSQIISLEGNAFLVQAGEDVVWNFDGEKGDSGEIFIKVLNKYVKVVVPR